MSYKDQPYSQRARSHGRQEAELAFEQNWPMAWDQYGLNDARSQMIDMPAFVRHTPDYLTSRQLVEVMGCGRDGIWKPKIAKVAALTEWQEKWTLKWFLYQSNPRRFAVVDHNWIKDKVLDGIDAGNIQMFPEGNKYVPLKVSEVDPTLWTFLDASPS
jgi:hypothetical protein